MHPSSIVPLKTQKLPPQHPPASFSIPPMKNSADSFSPREAPAISHPPQFLIHRLFSSCPPLSHIGFSYRLKNFPQVSPQEGKHNAHYGHRNKKALAPFMSKIMPPLNTQHKSSQNTRVPIRLNKL